MGDGYLGSRCMWFIDLVWNGIGACVEWNRDLCGMEQKTRDMRWG